MAWICISGNSCEVINGVWNSEGIAYFSISESLINVHNAFFEFVGAILPGTYGMMIILIILLFILDVFRNLRVLIKNA